MTRITDIDLDRFHQNAPAALARRGRSYMVGEVFGGVQTAVLGALPIVGMIYWGWSGIEMFVFLIVSLWVGIACDITKFIWLQKRAQAFADARLNDWHVWVVVEALRAGREEAPANHLRAHWEPWNGVWIDCVFGVISTMLILALLIAGAGVDFGTAISRGPVLGLILISIIRVLSTILEIRQHRQADATRGQAAVSAADLPVKAVLGLRGAALFMLMFLVVFLVEELEGNTDIMWIIAMSVVNGLVVLWGLLNAFGWLWIRGETRWLREYLEQR